MTYITVQFRASKWEMVRGFVLSLFGKKAAFTIPMPLSMASEIYYALYQYEFESASEGTRH